MPTYYLRMEGVNLDSVLSDTNQISVIRGASLLLREATHRIEEKFAFTKFAFTKISSGASIGLFQFDAPDQDAAEKIREQVENHLSQDEQLCHFTFVVDIQIESCNFGYDKEALIARNRFRQLQQPTFAFPTATATDKPCALTNLPASKKETISKKEQDVSDSVSERFKHGRDQKYNKFYQRETRQETGIDLKFTDSLQELAEPDANTPKNLGHKIAVLYLDGNDFSKIQKTHCKNPQDLRKFDEQVQAKRREFLTEFLKKVHSDPLFFNYDEVRKVRKVRLETLLWGGDEMLFVVPAWKGLELLNYFYQVSHDWKFKDEKLTHAGGLVFCRAKTPIRRIRKFAEELANRVKDSKNGREENLFDYMALESIDYPSEPLDKLRKKIFADALRQNYKPLQPLNDDRLDALAELKEIVPKSQAYNLVRAIIQGDKQEEKIKRLKVVITDKQYLEALDKLEQAFPQQTFEWRWIHLIELWDYIVPTASQV